MKKLLVLATLVAMSAVAMGTAATGVVASELQGKTNMTTNVDISLTGTALTPIAFEHTSYSINFGNQIKNQKARAIVPMTVLGDASFGNAKLSFDVTGAGAADILVVDTTDGTIATAGITAIPNTPTNINVLWNVGELAINDTTIKVTATYTD